MHSGHRLCFTTVNPFKAVLAVLTGHNHTVIPWYCSYDQSLDAAFILAQRNLVLQIPTYHLIDKMASGVDILHKSLCLLARF